eukprot:TRINITY_DN3331_c1_g1_i1.p1 TRINITY_DN3331_c1_g1~~TRINITY_DN3331_c1_g1_i1.p1  ORF type:complete len:235 (+),score=43.14 TRINITY_DN3331_c1_g1_i1:107-706(+)
MQTDMDSKELPQIDGKLPPGISTGNYINNLKVCPIVDVVPSISSEFNKIRDSMIALNCTPTMPQHFSFIEILDTGSIDGGYALGAFEKTLECMKAWKIRTDGNAVLTSFLGNEFTGQEESYQGSIEELEKLLENRKFELLGIAQIEFSTTTLEILPKLRNMYTKFSQLQTGVDLSHQVTSVNREFDRVSLELEKPQRKV